MPYLQHDTGSEQFENLLANRERFWRLQASASVAAREQDLYIMEIVDDKTEQEVDEDWERFMSMTKPFRRKADWITLQYFGMTNQEIYDQRKSRFMVSHSRFAIISDGNVGDINTPVNYHESSDLYYVPKSEELQPLDNMLDTIENVDLKMQEADAYSKETGYVMIIPSKIANEVDLEKVHDAFDGMIHRHKVVANRKAVELFGLSNEQIYIAMKRRFETDRDYKTGFIKDEVDPIYMNLNNLREHYISTCIRRDDFTDRELAEALTTVHNQQDFFYKMSGDRIIDRAIDQHNGMAVNVPSAVFDYTDLPMYSPDEMIDMGVSPHGNPEENMDGDVIPSVKWDSKGWFDEYKNLWEFGVCTDAFNKSNLERIHVLERLYITPKEGDPTWESAVRRCGWNPAVLFNYKNRTAVDFGANQRLKENGNTYNFIDVSDQSPLKEADIQMAVQDAIDPVKIDRKTVGDSTFDGSPLRPIYIALVGGQAAFSKVIKAVTQSKYSHCTMSLDPSMRRCYSYGTDPAVSMRGGFIIEDLITRPHDTWIRVYTVFVSNEIYETIKKNIEHFIKHQKDTFYSWANLITYLFKVPMERDNALICSQFVDRMLKLGKVDFTKTKSSLISPKDMDNFATRSKSVYTVYKGEIAKYKPEIVTKRVKALMTRAKAFTGDLRESCLGAYEQFIFSDKDAATTFYASYQGKMDKTQNRIWESLIIPCCEVKEIPIKIDNNGDVFISNLATGNYEAEFAKSHKLLMEYEREGNTEAMKTELCKLWAILTKIEEKLYGPHSIKPEKRRQLYSTRAHIIQDFKKYLGMVQGKEKDFNFAAYYDESPYSNNKYKISGSTIHGVVKLAKEIL